jgi:membrane protein
MAVATSGSGRNTSSAGGPNSTLWTLVLGAALVRLVTAKRRAPFAEVMVGRRRSSGGRGASKSARSFTDGEAEEKEVTERDRGRAADKPSEIPAKGWKDVLWRVYEEMNRDRVLAVAAGCTFYSLLAIFPGIAALVSLYGLFADAGTINQHLATLGSFLPGGALDIIGEQVKRIASKPSGSLGFAFFSGLAIALWSANAGMKALFDALNIVYDEEEKRSFIKLNAQSLMFTAGALLFLLLAIGAIVVIPVVLKLFWFGKGLEWLMSLLRWPLLYLAVLFGLACLYRYGPSRDQPQWRWVTWGSAIAGFVWLAASMLFSWYVANFGNYNETYGSLGAAIGFMTWIWISTTIVLLGGEINAELEHQTAKDTTVGGKQPIGARGAKMADTVGKAKT